MQFFKILDGASKEHLASFYLDPYARPENKRGGAWMGVCPRRASGPARQTDADVTGTVWGFVTGFDTVDFTGAKGAPSPDAVACTQKAAPCNPFG